MLSLIKDFVKGLIPLGMYLSGLLAALVATSGRPYIALLAIVVVSPLPNVWYQVHQFPFGQDILDLLTIAGLAGVLVGGLRKQPSRAGAFLLLYLLVTYLAVWNASLRYGLPLPLTTSNSVFVFWKNYAQMVLLYILAYHALGDEKKRKLIVAACMVALFLIVLREARNFTEGASFSYERRAEGPFWITGLGPNHFGAFVVHYAAVALGLSSFIRNRYIRWFLWLTAGLALQPIFFSYSRGAYLATIVVLLAFGVLKQRILLLVLVMAAFSWEVLLPKTVVERVTMTATPEGELESSAGSRIVLWERAFGLFESSPVFGVGLKGFALSAVGGRYTNAHNLYIETLAEQGIFGLLFLLAVMLRALMSSWRLYRGEASDFDRGLGLGMIGCCLAVIATNIFGDRWSYFEIGAYYWVFWGAVDRANSDALRRRQQLAQDRGSAKTSIAQRAPQLSGSR
jgi:O-antigen ligase